MCLGFCLRNRYGAVSRSWRLGGSRRARTSDLKGSQRLSKARHRLGGSTSLAERGGVEPLTLRSHWFSKPGSAPALTTRSNGVWCSRQESNLDPRITSALLYRRAARANADDRLRDRLGVRVRVRMAAGTVKGVRPCQATKNPPVKAGLWASASTCTAPTTRAA